MVPLSEGEPAPEFYNWQKAGTDYSSLDTEDIQRSNTSLIFLYEAPDGTVSLVVIHGKHTGDHEGGTASFTFSGLPDGGEWMVKDDRYTERTNYDNWSSGDGQVDWAWAPERTDGGVYGPLGSDFDIRIDPAFNEAATLYEEYYDVFFSGRVTEWQALSGDRSDPRRVELAMDEPIRLEVGACSVSTPPE